MSWKMTVGKGSEEFEFHSFDEPSEFVVSMLSAMREGLEANGYDVEITVKHETEFTI